MSLRLLTGNNSTWWCRERRKNVVMYLVFSLGMLQPTTWYPKDFYLLKIIWTIAKYIDLMNAYLTPLLVIVILFLEGLVPGQNIDMWSTIFLRFFD